MLDFCQSWTSVKKILGIGVFKVSGVGVIILKMSGVIVRVGGKVNQLHNHVDANAQACLKILKYCDTETP